MIEEYDVGPALHQRQLASVIWIVVGGEDRQELVRRDLVRRCVDVVRCRPDVVAKTRDELRRVDLEKARQFEALVTRPRPTQLLMDLTLGAKRVVTSENLDLIFRRLQESAAEDVQRRADEEIRKLKRGQSQQRIAWREQLVQEKSENERTAERLREEEKRRIDADHMIKQVKNGRTADRRWLDRSIVALRDENESRNRCYGVRYPNRHSDRIIFGFPWRDLPIRGGIGERGCYIGWGRYCRRRENRCMAALGKRTVCEKRLEFVRDRANEAGREDLLAGVEVDHGKMIIRQKDSGSANDSRDGAVEVCVADSATAVASRRTL